MLTVIVRLLLLPSFHKSLKHQKIMADLQPKMNEIKVKYKNDKEAQGKALIELYQTHKINPLSPCLPLLIQLPILIAMYQVFIRSLRGSKLVGLYSFVKEPASINPVFLHFIDLSKPNWIMAIIAGLLQYYATKITLPKTVNQDQTQKIMSYQTLYFLPAMTVFIGLKLPAGLALYWIITTLFGIGQQYYILWKEKKEALNAAK